jgi:hypothetical protein
MQSLDARTNEMKLRAVHKAAGVARQDERPNNAQRQYKAQVAELSSAEKPSKADVRKMLASLKELRVDELEATAQLVDALASDADHSAPADERMRKHVKRIARRLRGRGKRNLARRLELAAAEAAERWRGANDDHAAHTTDSQSKTSMRSVRKPAMRAASRAGHNRMLASRMENEAAIEVVQ